MLISAVLGPPSLCWLGSRVGAKPLLQENWLSIIKNRGNSPFGGSRCLSSCGYQAVRAFSQADLCFLFSLGEEFTCGYCQDAVEYSLKNGNDLVIIDTAGRLHIDTELMEELQEMKSAVSLMSFFLLLML